MLTSRRTFLVAAFALGGLACSLEAGQLSQNMQEWLKRLNSPEFGGGFAGRGRGMGGQWTDGGQGYLATERAQGGGTEIVRYDTATGNREVLMTAAQLTPPQLGKPLQFREYQTSSDGRRLLFAANPRTVMIRKTAFDYWVLDKAANTWRKLGGDAKSNLLYAKFSPDGSRVAYVRDCNIYVEDLATGAIKQLTTDGSDMIINGTSDWVYEEEFSLRDGFSWSPDGAKIAYFQFDQSGVPEFALINYTDTLYPVITQYPYPKAGQTNAAVRPAIRATSISRGWTGPTTPTRSSSST
jgi:dipeptidyl-peptidase-4